MNKKRRIIRWTVIWIGFVFIMMSLTPIILRITHTQNDVDYVPDADVLSRNAYLYYGIDKSEAIDGLLEKYYLQGWTFAEDNNAVVNDAQAMYANKDKIIRVYFRNLTTDKIYRVKTDRISRLDIFQTFSPSVKVNGMYHGFVASFSTVGLPQGEYRLVLESIENASVSGKMDTLMYFEKRGHVFRPVTWSGVKLPEEIPATDRVIYGIDGYALSDTILTISGWGFLAENEVNDSANTKIYARIANDIDYSDYEVLYGISRPDIASVYGETHLKCGFKVEIPREHLGEGGLVLSLIIEQNGTFCQANTTKEMVFSKETGFTLEA